MLVPIKCNRNINLIIKSNLLSDFSLSKINYIMRLLFFYPIFSNQNVLQNKKRSACPHKIVRFLATPLRDPLRGHARNQTIFLRGNCFYRNCSQFFVSTTDFFSIFSNLSPSILLFQLNAAFVKTG